MASILGKAVFLRFFSGSESSEREDVEEHEVGVGRVCRVEWMESVIRGESWSSDNSLVNQVMLSASCQYVR